MTRVTNFAENPDTEHSKISEEDSNNYFPQCNLIEIPGSPNLNPVLKLRFPDDCVVLRDICQTPNCYHCSHSSLLSAAEMNKAASFDEARFDSKQLTNMQLLSSSKVYIYKGVDYYAAQLVISMLIAIDMWKFIDVVNNLIL